MAKAKPGAKKSQPKPVAKKAGPKVGLLESGSARVVQTAAKLVEAAAKIAKPASLKTKKIPEQPSPVKPPDPSKKALPGKPLPAERSPDGKKPVDGKKLVNGKKPVDAMKASDPKKAPRAEVSTPSGAPILHQRPRATKLPAPGESLTPREMEQILTVGQGRGVGGEGSLKGRLSIKGGLPALMVVGRDKRELFFILQGPDQEVLPAYVDHKVSVTGFIRKASSQGGSVDVRKYSAKKPEAEVAVEAPSEQKLRYLSPGEVEQISNAGMGAGMRGFGSMRGYLELTGEDFLLVVSNGGTRQQVSFGLDGKIPKSLRKSLGQMVQVTGVVDKSSGWGGRIAVEVVEPRPSEFRAVSRDSLEMSHVEAHGNTATCEVNLNDGLTVRLPERPGHTWAIEPMMSKRICLREANFELAPGGTQVREFFFTPRNPGTFEVEFFLAKVFSPAQVAKTFRLNLAVKTV